MNLEKIGDQNEEFFKGHLFSYWQIKIGPAVKKLWSPDVLLCPHIHGSGPVRDQIGTLWY